MELSDRLRQLREERDLTQKDIGQMLGMSASAYGFYEQGRNDPSSENLRILADYYGCSLDYLVGKTNVRRWPPVAPGANSVRIPILGVIRAGEPLRAHEDVEDYELVSPEEARNGDYFYLRVVGDSMTNARIYPGDLVYVRQQADAEHRDIVVVMVDGEDATIKRLIKTAQGIYLQPESSNPAHEPIFFHGGRGDFRIIGKVLHWKSFPK